MNYIIDGHNLIPQLAGLDLSMPDDEQRLIELLVHLGRYKHHKLEVYFDRAAIGQAGVQNFGRVKAHYVSQNQIADDAIRKRLMSLGKSAKSWTVVSSDRAVQAAAREAHARVMSSADFASLLQAAPKPVGASPTTDEPLSEAEVREWEEIFKGQHRKK
jgi:predicted RNA-binding protein with PIN domain